MDLVLNFATVDVRGEIFRAFKIKYESPEQLRGLRTSNRETSVVSRRGSEIVMVPMANSARVAGEEVQLDVASNYSIVQDLMRNAVLRFIRSLDYRLMGDNPPRFLNRKADLLRGIKGNADPILDNLYLVPSFVISPRTLHKQKGEHIFGLQMDARLTVSIDLTIEALMTRGYSVVGKYAQIKRGYDDAWRMDWDERSQRQRLGQVSSSDGSSVVVDDTPYNPADLWLESRFENLLNVMEWAKVPFRQLQAIERKRHEYSRGDLKLKTVENMRRRLAENSIELCPGVLMHVGELFRPEAGYDAGDCHRASEPTFVFDLAREKTHRYPRVGLDSYGPFDVDSFPAKRAKILVVAPEHCQGEAERFLRLLKEGLPAASAFKKGFLRKFHLMSCDFIVKCIPGQAGGTAYRNVSLSAVGETPDANLAIVVTDKATAHLIGDANPYLVAKSVFMSQGVPVQSITIDVIRKELSNQSGLPYTLDNIALASYAKMGGSPYVMASNAALAQELVIGLGNALVKNASGGIERVVGITTVFSADGNYLLSTASREVSYGEYPNELLSTLKGVLSDTKSRNAWQPGDTIRLVFHVFKALKQTEADAVIKLVQSLTETYTVQYAFLHVSLDHDWFLFDRSEIGKPDHRRKDAMKGIYAPARGHLVSLGSRSILATVTGPSELKRADQGLPGPLLLNLHPASTFTDLDYLAGQAYRFTGLSWRSYLPSALPVTVGYSEQIARLLGRLRGVKNWNPDTLRIRMKSSRWFL